MASILDHLIAAEEHAGWSWDEDRQRHEFDERVAEGLPLWVFDHTPKAGGTEFAEICQQRLRRLHHVWVRWPDSALAVSRARLQRAFVLHGHGAHEAARFVVGRQVKQSTALREPLSLAISAFQQRSRRDGHAEVTARDVEAWIDELQGTDNVDLNLQARWLVRHGHDQPHAPSLHLSADDAATALHLLRSYDVLVEARNMNLLFDLIVHECGIPVGPAKSRGRGNASATRSESLLADLGRSARQALASLTSIDSELWEIAPTLDSWLGSPNRLHKRVEDRKFKWEGRRMDAPRLGKVARSSGDVVSLLVAAAPDPYTDSIVAGRPSAESLRTLEVLAKRSDVLLDIGANIGEYSCVLAHGVGAVVAVEPSAENANLLTANIALNGLTNVRVVRAAVVGFMGPSAVTLDGESAYAHVTSNGTGRESATIALNDLLSEVRPSVVKVDIEGYEEHLRYGLCDWIQAQHDFAIVVEINLGPAFVNGSMRVLEALHTLEMPVWSLYPELPATRLVPLRKGERPRRLVSDVLITDRDLADFDCGALAEAEAELIYVGDQ